MSQASRTIEIDVSPAEFRAVLDDYARYPDFIKEVKSVKVGPRTDTRVEVTYKLDVMIKTFEYTLEHVSVSPLRIEWKLLRGEFMRENVGFWQLEPTVTGKTRATYSIDLKLGQGVPATFDAALAQQGLPRLLASFKARAEQLHKRP